ncbi:MAG: cache domain-containing protein [Sulfurospirillaceae bacterium]|nr:cache domain-containing protein [Sulfurospirillaceae bacterium]
MFQEKHLPKLIFITPIVTIVLLTFFILSFFIFIERANLRFESEALEKQLLSQQKTTLSYEVQKVFNYFEYHSRTMRQNIDNELKDRVDDVHMMGINLYAKNNEQKSLTELRQDLLLTLSSLHVSAHRGYYFIVNSKGEIIYPQEELGDRIGLKSAVAEAMQNGGYATSEVGRPRRVYVKALSPYGWSIGAAEYLDLAMLRLKREMITWAESLRYAEGGYVWIHNSSHTLLAHPFRPDSIGKDDVLLQDINGQFITQLFVEKAMHSGESLGSFVEYSWPKPYENEPSKKISYVAFYKPWNWIVGTGIYVSDVEKTIALKKEEMKAKMDRYILGVIVIAIFSMMIVGFLSFLITQQINTALESYRSRVHNQTEALKEFNATLRTKINQALAESKQKDLALMHQSRLAQMGEMLSIIAHQWRQPLSEVSGIFMELETAAKFGKANKALIMQSAKEGDTLLSYMSRTIDDFRNFFKPSKERVSFSVQMACEEAFTLARATLKNAHISLQIKQHKSVEVMGFPNEYAQVVLNLLLNAKDVLMERQILLPQIWVEIGMNAEGKSLVCIRDNAGGIEESLMQSIFEPYVSTKKASSGTGLGLYMAKMIIEDNMNGKLYASNENLGAQFCIEV